MAESYYGIATLIRMIDEPNQARCMKLLVDEAARFMSKPGSSHNHQAWVGGYYDHICAMMNLALDAYNNARWPLPFPLSSALLVVYLHDLEKAWMYYFDDDGKICKSEGLTKEARAEFRKSKIAEYGIELTPDEENGLEFIEGIPDSKYTPGERLMGPLAAFCHCRDIESARLWPDYPLTENDPWTGAQRIRGN